MSIYTRFGDEGETALFGGEKVAKDTLRVRAYGGVDEMNASIGGVISLLSTASEAQSLSPLLDRLERIQSELFQLGGELATPRDKQVPMAVLEETHVEALEKEIDLMQKDLPPLKNFILPGGNLVAAHLHLARAVCRRAERDVITLHRAESVRKVVRQYMNRLSDYFFVCARWVNAQTKTVESPWIAPKG